MLAFVLDTLYIHQQQIYLRPYTYVTNNNIK